MRNMALNLTSKFVPAFFFAGLDNNSTSFYYVALQKTFFNPYVQAGTLFVLFVLALIGNSTILGKLWYHGYKTLHKMSSVSLLCFNLALADLLATFCCVLSSAILYLVETDGNGFTAGNVSCKLLRFLQRFCLVAGTFIVVIISVDRCMAVLSPMRKAYTGRSKMLFMIGVWILAACFSGPQVLVFKVMPRLNGLGRKIYECTQSDELGDLWIGYYYDLSYLIFLYVMPIAVIIVCYTLIFYKINQNAQPSSDDMLLPNQLSSKNSSSDGKRQALYLRARATSLMISLVVITTFVLCWAPFFISLVFHLITKLSTAEDYYYSHALYFCGLAHSVLNPVIYGAFHLVKRSRSSKSSQTRTSGNEKKRYSSLDRFSSPRPAR